MSTKVVGTVIAVTVAGMFAAANAHAQDAPSPRLAKVRCEGINQCKGKGACKSAENQCAGQNACKGKGWVDATAAECNRKGGKILN